MKFTCLKENLLKGFNTTTHLALKSSSLPILNNVLLRAEKNALTITSTNLEAGITHVVRGKTEEDGECLVPARLLLELTPLLPEDTIELILTNQGLVISGNKIKTTLNTLPITDFPIIPAIDHVQHQLYVPAAGLITALDKTLFATGKAEQKPQFSGLLFLVEEKNNKTLIIAGTDGYRLSEASVPLKKTSNTLKIILPATAAQELRRVLTQDNTSETAEIQISENQINLVIGTTQIISRLIDGEYPDYQQLFPENYLTECEAAKNSLCRAVKAAALFSRSGIYDVSLTVGPQNSVEIFSENASVGSSRTSIEAKTSGQETKITVNAKYLLEGVGAIDGEKVKIFLSGPERPIMLKAAGEEAVHFRHLIVLIKQT